VGKRKGVGWVVREGWGQGGEMTQASYAHMNNKIKIRGPVEGRARKAKGVD
jgi:hypothetical protein